MAFDKFRECVAGNLESHYRDQATNEDLQAQQDMAFWAMWLLIASIAGIGVSIAGVFLLIASLRHTRTAISDTRELGESAGRAYVNMTRADLYWGDEIGKFMFVKLFIKNSGNSPAVWFEIRHKFFLTKLRSDGSSEKREEFSDIAFDIDEVEFTRWNALASSEELDVLAQPTEVFAFGPIAMDQRKLT